MASINETSNTESKIAAEKEEENKLKSKYPQLQRPGPQFLQKRLQKGQKFFDSGDYNMAKAAAAKGTNPKSRLSDVKNQSGGGAVPPSLPPSLGSSSLNAAIVGGGGVDEFGVANAAGGDKKVIPTPDCLATRKASIHVPNIKPRH